MIKISANQASASPENMERYCAQHRAGVLSVGEFMRDWGQRTPEFEKRMLDFLSVKDGEQSNYFYKALDELTSSVTGPKVKKLDYFDVYIYALTVLGVRGKDFDTMYDRLFDQAATVMQRELERQAVLHNDYAPEIPKEIKIALTDDQYSSPYIHTTEPPMGGQIAEPRPSRPTTLSPELTQQLQRFRFKLDDTITKGPREP